MLFKMINEIDFTKVSCYEYDQDKYFENISFYKVVCHYLKLNHLRDRIFDYEIHLDNDIDGKTHYLRINDDINSCLFDFEPIDIESLVMILETNSFNYDDKLDAKSIVRQITGVDIKDYINHVWFENGEDVIIIGKQKQTCKNMKAFVYKKS